MASFKQWAREFARWIGKFFGASERQITIVADEYNRDAAIYRIADDGIPGCVELWKIVHRKSNGDLVLILLDIAQLRQDLGLRNPGVQPHSEPWQNKLSRQLAVELKTQADVDSSHMVIVLWLRDRTLIDPKGRSYRVPAANLVGAWCCELQGATGSIAGNRYAQQIIKVAAYKIFKTTSFQLLTWEEFVDAIPWLEWLDAYAKHYIWAEHTLQPRRPTKKSPSRSRKI